MAKLGEKKVAKVEEPKAAGSNGGGLIGVPKGDLRLLCVLHGRPTSGKSWAALQASKFWPVELPAKKLTRLEDTLWISADPNAVAATRREANVEVPSIDLATLLAAADPELGDEESGRRLEIVMKKMHAEYKGEQTVLDILRRVTEETYNAVQAGGITHVCVDSLSPIDRSLVRFWEVNAPPTKSGARDSFAMWRSVCNAHDRFNSYFRELPCSVTFIAHSKPRSESAPMAAKAAAGGLPASNDMPGDYVFDLAYEDTRNIYRRGVDFTFLAVRKSEGGQVRRSLILDPDDAMGFETKNRYERTFPPGMVIPSSLGFVRARLEEMGK